MLSSFTLDPQIPPSHPLFNPGAEYWYLPTVSVRELACRGGFPQDKGVYANKIIPVYLGCFLFSFLTQTVFWF